MSDNQPTSFDEILGGFIYAAIKEYNRSKRIKPSSIASKEYQTALRETKAALSRLLIQERQKEAETCRTLLDGGNDCICDLKLKDRIAELSSLTKGKE